jgi:HlyD family secretion protein
MSRLRVFLVLSLIPIAALVWWVRRRDSQPAEVPVAKVQRQTLVSTLETNGKVEPSEFVIVRAERTGMIEKVDVQKGQQVRKAQLLVELNARDAQAEVASAEAGVAEAKAQMEALAQGGRSSAQVEIDNAIARARMELKTAQRDYEALRRLADKQAAAQQEVLEAQQRAAALQEELEGLERKRGALVAPVDRAAAEARLRQAQAALEQARARLERGQIESPTAGSVYDLPARPGMYVTAGDPVASVGDLKTLRVRVYVDEPELGRVSKGMPVTITWDALPGRQWKGTVESMPSAVVPLGTRQVGEFICTISNPGLDLIPGTNVNAQIVSQVVENGLTIPKEALRRQGPQSGVFVLRDGRLHWAPVTVGATSITHASVVGLSEGDLVVLTTEKPLADGAPAQPAGR